MAKIRAMLDSGLITAAETDTRAYLERNPNSADGYFLLGYILFREQKAKDSLAAFTEGAKYRRPGASELKIVASDYILFGDFSDADTWLSAVTTETPEDADAWYLLGRTKYNENRFEEAIRCFDRVVALRPHDVKAKDNQGLSYQGLNRVEEAKAAFETAIEWQKDDPRKDAQPYMNLGILLMSEEQPEAALPHLEKAAALAPHNPKVREELGQAYEQLKMLPKAQAELEAAVALAPTASGLHFKLGQIYRRLGMQEKAQEQFDLCSKLIGAHSSIEIPNPAVQD